MHLPWARPHGHCFKEQRGIRSFQGKQLTTVNAIAICAAGGGYNAGQVCRVIKTDSNGPQMLPELLPLTLVDSLLIINRVPGRWHGTGCACEAVPH